MTTYTHILTFYQAASPKISLAKYVQPTQQVFLSAPNPGPLGLNPFPESTPLIPRTSTHPNKDKPHHPQDPNNRSPWYIHPLIPRIRPRPRRLGNGNGNIRRRSSSTSTAAAILRRRRRHTTAATTSAKTSKTAKVTAAPVAATTTAFMRRSKGEYWS